MVSSAVLSTALMLLAVPATEEVEPVNVYVYARTVGAPLSKSEKKAREKELKEKKDDARQARKDLDKRLKAQFGKDRDEWPEQQQEEYRLAKEAETMAQFEHDYLKHGIVANGEQHYPYDSVEGVTKAIQRKKKWIRLVHNKEQAHLLVEVLDRRPYGFVLAGHRLHIAVRISPGRALISNQLSEIRPKGSWWRADRKIEVVHAFREQEPFWIIECTYKGQQDQSVIRQPWSRAASRVAGMIDDFVKDNRAVLMGEAPTQ